MKDQFTIEELASCDYLYLEAISEPHVNTLCLILSEGIISDRTETLIIGDASIADVHSIEVRDASRRFEIVWGTLISYAVRNESYCTWDKDEEWTGNVFRTYTRSKFLDFVSAGTFASADYPGPFVHYGIICLDHIIDVASEHPPIIHCIDG